LRKVVPVRPKEIERKGSRDEWDKNNEVRGRIAIVDVQGSGRILGRGSVHGCCAATMRLLGNDVPPAIAAKPRCQKCRPRRLSEPWLGLTPMVRGRDSRRGRREHFRRRGRRRYGQPIAPLPTALIRPRSCAARVDIPERRKKGGLRVRALV
jgi:hypothetical protein